MNIDTIAKYLRISDEDVNCVDESQSIKGQRSLLNHYIESRSEFENTVVLEFCDDGYTGTNFERPGLQELFRRIRKKEVNCVITKDISRFSRNYLDTCDYLEQIFPFMGVRFISVNDNYDSNNYLGKTGGLEISIPSLVYSMYSQDISNKSKSGILTKMQKGEYVGNYAFYGYKKLEGSKSKLVIDEEAAQIVNRIFESSKDGNTASEIARLLNSEQILSPAAYKFKNGCKMTWDIANNEKLWCPQTIRRILKDERYTGKMIYGKQKKVQIGSKKAIKVPKEEWIVVDNINIPIISQEDFDSIQHIDRNLRYVPHNIEYPFYGKIRCGYCKRIIRRSRSRNKYFSCVYKKKVVGVSCMDKPVLERDLTDCVFSAIQTQIGLAEKASKTMLQFNKNLQKEFYDVEEKIKALQKDILKATSCREEVYEKYLDGIITDDKFTNIRFQINQRIQATEDAISKLESTKNNTKILDNDFMNTAKTFIGIKEITKEVVTALIKTIYVYDENRVEIVWNFGDDIANILNLMQDKCEASG